MKLLVQLLVTLLTCNEALAFAEPTSGFGIDLFLSF